MEAITCHYGENIALPQPIRTGYTFKGWSKTSSLNETCNWVTMPDLTPNEQSNGSIMLYGKWEVHTYYVNYCANGGSGIMSQSTHTYDISKTLTPNGFSKLYYDFLGWSTTSTGEVVYQDKESVLNLTDINKATFNLYAVWAPKRYSLICKNLATGMTVYPVFYTYGEGLSEMPTVYVSSGHGVTPLNNFYGWYTSSSFTTRVYSISSTQTGDVTIYAKYDYWLGTTFANYTQTVTDDVNAEQPSFNVSLANSIYYEQVRYTTLSKIRITIAFDMWEVDDGYQDLYLYNGNTQVWTTTINRGVGKNTEREHYLFTTELNLYEYKDVDFMELTFSAHGAFADTWQFDNFEMSIYYVN